MLRVNSSGNQPYLPQGVQTGRQPTAGNGGASPAPPASSNDTVSMKQSEGYQQYIQLQHIHEQMGQTAIGIRTTSQQLSKAGHALSQMKAELNGIIKNYPPFAQGDPQRIKYLRTFNGINKQIEGLMLPPDDRWYGKTPGDTSSGSSGKFAVPALPEQATDGQINAAIGRIDEAMQSVEIRQRQLAGYASSVSQATVQEVGKAAVGQASMGWDLSFKGDTSAEQQSKDAAVVLSQAVSSDVSLSRGKLNELLR